MGLGILGTGDPNTKLRGSIQRPIGITFVIDHEIVAGVDLFGKESCCFRLAFPRLTQQDHRYKLRYRHMLRDS